MIPEGYSGKWALIDELRERRYISAAMPVLENNLRCIERFQKGFRVYDPQEISARLPQAYEGYDLRRICLPGDVVLGTISGVVFIPAHLAEYVAIRAEKTYLRDSFSFERLESGTYTSAQVDQAWWPEFMMTDFMDWFHHSAKAENYQYLDWSEEMEDSKKPPRQKQFDGIVCYSYH